MTPKYMRELRRNIDKGFNEAEFKILVDDINIDWDHLVGQEKLAKIQSLLKRLQRDGKLGGLIKLLREERPNEAWDDPPPAEQQVEDAKLDITDAERRGIFDSLVDKVGPLATGVLQIKTLVEANIGYLDTRQTGDLVRLLANVHLANYVKLRSISLKNEILNDFNLSGADLRGADLTQAFLTGVDLTGADLAKANIAGADLRDAKLTGVNLQEAKLTGANLAGANLAGAKIWGADLSDANLSGANLAGASIAGANLAKADLFYADLTGAHVSGGILVEAILYDTTTMPNGEKYKPNKEG